MTKLMEGIDGVLVYIDDLLIITKGTFEEHVEGIKLVLQRMKEKDLQINIDKSKFAVQEIDYLGYILTREGIRPQPKKVQGILEMKQPKTPKEFRGFIGTVIFTATYSEVAPIISLHYRSY